MKKILVSDSDLSVMAAFAWYLKDLGYFVVTASGYAETEKAFVVEKPDLAIWDMRMNNDSDCEDRSGLVLARELAGRVPIIVWSAAWLPEGEILPEGVYFLEKSIGVSKIVEFIEGLLV